MGLYRTAHFVQVTKKARRCHMAWPSTGIACVTCSIWHGLDPVSLHAWTQEMHQNVTSHATIHFGHYAIFTGCTAAVGMACWLHRTVGLLYLRSPTRQPAGYRPFAATAAKRMLYARAPVRAEHNACTEFSRVFPACSCVPLRMRLRQKTCFILISATAGRSCSMHLC